MSPITTHVLDLARGRPADGIAVVLDRFSGNDWHELARDTTNIDGRLANLWPDGTAFTPGTYRLRFATDSYFSSLGIRAFFPEVHLIFQIEDASGHYHVPLLLSPYGYSTYRGS